MVVYRLGRLRQARAIGPGIVLVLPCIDEHYTIDLRTMSYDVSQEVLSKDAVTLSVDTAVYFRTHDAVASISRVFDAHLSTKQLAQTTLVNILGTMTLTDIMAGREGIALQAQKVLDEATLSWGIKVERVELKDIKLQRELMKALAVEAEATTNANARVVMALGEFESSFSLKEAADKLSQNSIAIQLRYLQTLTRVSKSKNHTIVLPIPIEIIRKFITKLKPKKSQTSLV
uniref:PHB domain-containing protein n=1 Tax=Rhabditophanes sp. KR3021 TaxID=114890 RepID=A0AC35TG59_9BILA